MMHKVQISGQSAIGGGYAVIRSSYRKANVTPCASTSAPAAEAATARTRRCATSPGRAVTDPRPLVEASSRLRGGQGNVRPSFFLPTRNRLASRAQKARAGSSSAGAAPTGRRLWPSAQPSSVGPCAFASLITRPAADRLPPGTSFREPSAHVVVAQPAAWADGLR